MIKQINGREKTNFPCRKIPNNVCRLHPQGWVENNSPLFKDGLSIMTFL